MEMGFAHAVEAIGLPTGIAIAVSPVMVALNRGQP